MSCCLAPEISLLEGRRMTTCAGKDQMHMYVKRMVYARAYERTWYSQGLILRLTTCISTYFRQLHLHLASNPVCLSVGDNQTAEKRNWCYDC
jgi:hypothetical protein